MFIADVVIFYTFTQYFVIQVDSVKMHALFRIQVESLIWEVLKQIYKPVELTKLQLMYISQYSSFTRFFFIFTNRYIFWLIITDWPIMQSFRPAFSGLTRRNITMFYLLNGILFGNDPPSCQPLKQRVLFFCAGYLWNTKGLFFAVRKLWRCLKMILNVDSGCVFHALLWLHWTWFHFI